MGEQGAHLIISVIELIDICPLQYIITIIAVPAACAQRALPWGSAGARGAGGGPCGAARGVRGARTASSGWSKMLTGLWVAASHSRGTQASGSPAAQPRQPPTSAAGGERVRRPTSAGKGGGSYSNGVLSWHVNIKVGCCIWAIPSSLTGRGEPHPPALGWKRERADKNRLQFQWAPGFPCPAPRGQAGEEGRGHTDAFWIFNFHSRVRLLFLPDSFLIFPLTPQVTTEVVMFPVF